MTANVNRKLSVMLGAAALAAAFSVADPVRSAESAVNENIVITELAKSDYDQLSKGKVLMVYSADYPEVMKKVFKKVMASRGIVADLVSSNALPSKTSAFYIDGTLVQLRIADYRPATVIRFSDLGGAMAVITGYIERTKAPVTGPVASP